MAFVLADEATSETDNILESFAHGAKAAVPALWRWEVGNVLLMAERRRRITNADTSRHLVALASLPIETDGEASRQAWNASLLIARKYRLSLYDAAYVELATRLGVALGTLDVELRKAAKAEGVKLLPETL